MMVWNKIWRMFGGRGEPAPRSPAGVPTPSQDKPVTSTKQAPELHWIEAADNPWGIRVLDVRPVTLNIVSTSTDPQCATNAVSFGNDDGLGFVGQAPASE